MRKLVAKESGTVLVAVALFLLLLLAFVALGSEAGRWYLVRAELSKSVDAGALVGAKNISNPYVDPRALAGEFCQENFKSGSLGTPGSGTGSVGFDVQISNDDQIRVDGNVNAVAILSRMMGFDQIPVAASGIAQMRRVEIMLVLDRSGSMSGQPMADLKVAAKSFLDYFVDTQTRDRIGLVSFATSVQLERPIGINYVTPMKSAIDAMNATGHTNPEDALDRADGPGGFADQSALAPENRIQQFLVFFSDGRPNTFRGTFRSDNTTYDATACVDGNCDPGDPTPTNPSLHRTDIEQSIAVPSTPTGDGVFPASACGTGMVTTKWQIFNTRPVPGYAPDACDIPDPDLGSHICNLAATMAIEHAQELKDKGIIFYSIGLGTRINSNFLEALASSPAQVFMAPTSDELQAIFQRVAQDIKLRLVQ
ncbi:MAG TPA: vWA domain-containing protein [Candidatus Limnocylindria bacterium]|nr:vWA domain-containing protein [Candidatus Limnocylindria bacterium]